jgi:hypothetical protein
MLTFGMTKELPLVLAREESESREEGTGSRGMKEEGYKSLGAKRRGVQRIAEECALMVERRLSENMPASKEKKRKEKESGVQTE